MHFKGLYTAMITPFTDEGEVDVQGFIDLIQRQNEAGVAGIMVLGTTGESCALDHFERKLIIQTAVKYANVPVIVGTGTSSTRAVIEYTCEAEELGADGALIVTPYYVKPTQEGLFQHYKAVHDASGLPIMLYNNPPRCVVNIAPETVLRIAALERVTAVKDCSGNLSQLADMIASTTRLRTDFTVLTGDDCMTLPSLTLGAAGLVSVLSNIYPKEICAYVDMCLKGDVVSARAEHYRWQPVIRELFAETNPISVKAMMRSKGLPAGKCRLPL